MRVLAVIVMVCNCVRSGVVFRSNSYQGYQYYNLIRQARFIFIHLIRDAQIKRVIKPNKYKVEEN